MVEAIQSAGQIFEVVVVDQFTPGYQFTPTPKFIQNNHS